MSSEGYVPFRGHRTWYEIHGTLGAGVPPLIVLHGGPGVPHDYLDDLARLADRGRPVIFYDQLGCGRSDQPDDDSLWVLDTFVDELATVRRTLGLKQVHILGHSWGGWLALEYVLRPGSQQGLLGLVLASTCPSLPKFGLVTRTLKALLPPDVQQTLDRHEAEGTTEAEEYQAASFAYIGRYLYRRDPLPDNVLKSLREQNEHVYSVIQGPEWNIIGNLRDWDVTDRLGEIVVPTLVTSGRYDEMIPAIVEPLAAGIAGARWVMFENSAHIAMSEEPDRYVQVVGDFLREVDGSGT